MHLDCAKPENQTPARAMREALEAIWAVHTAFGAPGDYGYGTREGEALRWLYDSLRLLGPTLKALDPDEHAKASANINKIREHGVMKFLDPEELF